MDSRVGLAVLLLGALGCHQTLVTGQSGGASSGRDMALGDASTADATTGDAGPGDAGSVDFGEECAPRRADVACTGPLSGDPPFAGEPFALGLAVGGPGECFCGESVECAVRQSAEGLALETAVCSRGPLCDACFPYTEGACEIPALAPGRYPVSVNGEPGLVLDLVPRPMGSAAALETCFGTAPVPEAPACPSSALSPENIVAPDEMCVPARSPLGRVTFSLAADCEACTTEAGSCRVIRNGTGLLVSATPLVGLCRIGCPDICFRREWSCTTPPLEAGEYELTVLETGLSTTLVVEPGGAPAGETCVSARR
ncbi:MAG: hypothetical protein AAF447_15255 [Myxococcota bacterium]